MTNNILFHMLSSHQMVNVILSFLTIILMMVVLTMMNSMTIFLILPPNITTHYLITLEDISIDMTYMVLTLTTMILTMTPSQIAPYSMTSINITHTTQVQMMM